jgi:polysaccharide biosynthesis protein PslG
VLAISGFARDAPLTDAAQARFCAYASAALELVPDARAVVIWDEANSPTFWRGTPAQYESLLARCYDVLHRHGLTVLDSTASAHKPAAFLAAVGAAYRASGRTRPLVDAFGHNPYPRNSHEPPTAVHAGDFLGEGDYVRLAATLRASFGVRPAIWYLEDGYQSQVPPLGYVGRENTAVVTPAQQALKIASAIRLAACQPLVHAFFNFELVDEARLSGWQSGLIWRGGRPKPAASAFAAAARSAAGGCRARP